MRAQPWRGPALLADRYPDSGLAFRLLMATIDAVLAAVLALRPGRRAGAPFPQPPRRILVIATAHLGDVVIATSALRDLKRLYPHARLGVVVGAWGRAVLDGHPGVQWLHVIDHPRMNRRDAGPVARLKAFVRTASTAVPAIRAIGYDVVYDLQERHSLLPLVPWLGIRHRVGTGTGGWSPLLTERVRPMSGRLHRAELHRHVILRGRAAPPAGWPAPSAWLPAPRRSGPTLPAGYVTLHPGTGDPARRWPDAHWLALGRTLHQAGVALVCCGVGADDRRTVRSLADAGLPVVDLVDTLDVASLGTVIAGAACVVGMESSPAHLGAAHGVPVVTVFSGVAPAPLFEPLGERVDVIRLAVPCAPCHRFCATVDCVRGVEPGRVAERVLARLAVPAAPATPASRDAPAASATSGASGPSSPPGASASSTARPHAASATH